MATRYLYLRTNLPIEHSKDAILSLRALNDYWPEVLGIGKLHLGWRDGLVIKFESSQTPKAICSWLGPKLSKFEAWACHDGLNRCDDYPQGAQASTFFEGLGSRSVSQLFLEYEKSDPRLESLVDRLKTTLEFNAKAKCRSVVDFRNGKILLIAANEPQRITFNRCQAFLREKIRYAFIGPDKLCYSSFGAVEDEAAWTQMRFSTTSNRGVA